MICQLLFYKISCAYRHDKEIHDYEMADASSHNKEVKNLVGAKVFMPGVENRKLQGIDHTSYGIDQAAGQQPAEPCRRKGFYDRHKGKYTQPSHSDVNY